MMVSRVNTKGQVTIPKTLLERFGFRPGDEIEFIEVEGGLRLQKRQQGSPFSRYRGYLSHLKGQDPDALLEAMRGQ
jgi:AbrB family looped-hinge helix DNA binding protein